MHDIANCYWSSYQCTNCWYTASSCRHRCAWGFINVQIWPIELACYTTLRMSHNIKYPLISFAYSRPARPACQKTNHCGSRNKKINMRAIYFADSKLTDFKNMFCLCQCGHEHFSDLQHALGHLCNKTSQHHNDDHVQQTGDRCVQLAHPLVTYLSIE